MDDSSLLECIGEMRFNVRNGLFVGGCTCYLGTLGEIKLCVSDGYFVCSVHRLLQETLGGEDDGYAIL